MAVFQITGEEPISQLNKAQGLLVIVGGGTVQNSNPHKKNLSRTTLKMNTSCFMSLIREVILSNAK